MDEVMRVYELPYPPSVNHYYRRVGQATLISREGRRYRKEVVARLAALRLDPLYGRLAAILDLHPPSRRTSDLDNRLKAALDAMEHAGAYENDAQIDLLVARRGSVRPGGDMHVRLEQLPIQRCPLCGGGWNG